MSTPVFMNRGQLRLEEQREQQENPDTEKLEQRKALAAEMEKELLDALDGKAQWKGWMGSDPHRTNRWWLK